MSNVFLRCFVWVFFLEKKCKQFVWGGVWIFKHLLNVKGYGIRVSYKYVPLFFIAVANVPCVQMKQVAII